MSLVVTTPLLMEVAMAHAPKPRTDDEVAATRRKLARLLALGALRAIEADRSKKPEDDGDSNK